MEEDYKIRLKKLTFRSKNRGCKEMDLVLTRFAHEKLPQLNSQELDIYEELLEEPDDFIWKWLTKEMEMPVKYQDILGRA